MLFSTTPTGEVDFYVPKEETAYQVSYSIADDDTRQRELAGFKSLPKKLDCNRRIILTYDEEETITYGEWTIEVIPVWKWLLDMTRI